MEAVIVPTIVTNPFNPVDISSWFIEANSLSAPAITNIEPAIATNVVAIEADLNIPKSILLTIPSEVVRPVNITPKAEIPFTTSSVSIPSSSFRLTAKVPTATAIAIRLADLMESVNELRVSPRVPKKSLIPKPPPAPSNIPVILSNTSLTGPDSLVTLFTASANTPTSPVLSKSAAVNPPRNSPILFSIEDITPDIVSPIPDRPSTEPNKNCRT